MEQYAAPSGEEELFGSTPSHFRLIRLGFLR
jgi:hypothetical protein